MLHPMQALRRWRVSRMATALLLIGLFLILTELLVLLAGYLQLADESVALAQYRYTAQLEYIFVSLALLLAGTYLVERTAREQAGTQS